MGHNFFMQMRLKVPQEDAFPPPVGKAAPPPMFRGKCLPSFPSQPQVHGVSGESLVARSSQNRHKIIFSVKIFCQAGI